LSSFDKYLLTEHKDGNGRNKIGISYSSIGIDMRNIRAVFNDAIQEGQVDPKLYPFGRRKYIIPSTKKGKKALDLDDIRPNSETISIRLD
jgi:hypothetical protein